MFSEPGSGRLLDGLVTINTPLKEAIRSNQFVGRKGKNDRFSQLALFRLPIFHFTNQYPARNYGKPEILGYINAYKRDPY